MLRLSRWHILALLIACSGCRPSNTTAAGTVVASHDTATANPQASSLRERADSELIAHLRALAPELKETSVHLYSPLDDSTEPTTGRALAAEDYAFFRPAYPSMGSSGELFAIGYLALGPGQTAYVLRVPSKYDPSSLALWIHDDNRDYWLPPVPIADAYGDADWSFQQDAWLVDRDGDGKRDLVQRRTDWEGGRIVADTLTWSYWQANFDQFGSQQLLKDPASSARFVLEKREH